MRRPTLVLVLVAMLGVVACTRRQATPLTDEDMGLEVPLQGVWQFPPLLDESIYLLVSYEDGAGLLRVEKAGLIAHRYVFDVTGPRSIRIRGAKGAPSSITEFSLADIKAIAGLQDPPPDIRLEIRDTEPRGEARGQTRLTLHGLLDTQTEVFSYYRVEEDRRVNLPFAEIKADVRLEVPEGAEGVFAQDGAWGVRNIRFKEPIHPIGEVRSLSINGSPIVLERTQLVGGMLRTRDFGEMEVLLTSPFEFSILVTRPQVDAIRAHLERSSSEAGGPGPS